MAPLIERIVIDPERATVLLSGEEIYELTETQYWQAAEYAQLVADTHLPQVPSYDHLHNDKTPITPKRP